MAHWQNWSGRLTAQPQALHFIRSEDDAAALCRQIATDGLSLRTAGATHSHAPLVQHDGVIADCRGLSGVIETNQEQQTAWVWGGSRIYSLGEPLRLAGLGLPNQGDIDEQAIAGATATGTHGTGQKLRNLSAAVVGMTLATAAGELQTYSLDSYIGRAARLHLGAFGIVTRLQLKLREAYALAEHSWQVTLDEVLSDATTQIQANRHFEFFWYPQADQAQAKTLNETDPDNIQHPVAAEGQRVAWSYEVLPNHRPHKHTEMEYSMPADRSVECMQAIRSLLKNDFPDVAWPVEFRTLAADDVWLSTAYEQPTVTISVHEDVRNDESRYYKACEEIFLSFGGRPHWGKVHYLNGSQLAARHPRWDDWWQARDSIDPQGVFLNQFLRSIRP